MMELRKDHFRAMILYDYQSGLHQDESVARLVAAFGDQAPSRSTVFRWFSEFKHGRTSLEDEERSGRPSCATTEEQIAVVRALVEDDARVTVAQLVQETNLSSGSVSTILHDKLGLRKISARWIPHLLSPEQKDARVKWCRQMLRRFNEGRSNEVTEIVTGDETWVYSFEPESKQQSAQWTPAGGAPPNKCRRDRSAAKQMVAVFVARSGHVTTVPLVTQRTVTANWYRMSRNVCHAFSMLLISEVQRDVAAGFSFIKPTHQLIGLR